MNRPAAEGRPPAAWRRWPACLLLLLLAASAARADAVIVVTSTGWHTGIAVARADLPATAIPETADFPDAAYVEFGWGDAAYYPAAEPSLALTLKAAFPGPAVVHLAGLPDHPARTFPTIEWRAVTLTDDGLRGLIAYLDASFDRQGARRLPASAPGLYSFSRFYPATGRFHAFNTCNTWTAGGLAAAGLAVDPTGVQRAADVMRQLAGPPDG